MCFWKGWAVPHRIFGGRNSKEGSRKRLNRDAVSKRSACACSEPPTAVQSEVGRGKVTPSTRGICCALLGVVGFCKVSEISFPLVPVAAVDLSSRDEACSLCQLTMSSGASLPNLETLFSLDLLTVFPFLFAPFSVNSSSVPQSLNPGSPQLCSCSSFCHYTILLNCLTYSSVSMTIIFKFYFLITVAI